MPLKIDEIKKMNPENCYRLAEGSGNLSLIAYETLFHSNMAYTADELRSKINHDNKDTPGFREVGRSSIYYCLDRLVKKERVKKKGSYYWYEG